MWHKTCEDSNISQPNIKLVQVGNGNQVNHELAKWARLASQTIWGFSSMKDLH